MSVTRERRFTRERPCPICSGHPAMPRGQGERCHGFLSGDSRYAHCTREEHAGGLDFNPESGTYAHRLDGPCLCGVTHGMAQRSSPNAGATKPVIRRDSDFEKCPWPYPADYRDANGQTLYRIGRWKKLDGSKTYGYFRPDGPDRWLSGRGDVGRVVYRLPEARQAIDRRDALHVPEGEKCVHLLVDLGFEATCNDGGAEKWCREHTECLRGARRVIIWMDNDDSGRRHVEKVARALHEAGIPDIRVPALPGLAEGEGIDDWLARRQPGDAAAVREELEQLVENTMPWRPSADSERPGRDDAHDDLSQTRPTIVVRNELSEVVDAAEAALLADPAADIYERGRFLVRIVRDAGEPRKNGLVREPNSPIIQPLPLDALRERIDRVAEWVRFNKRDNDYQSALPPEWVARTIMARGAWKFPRLVGIVEQPTMRRDGTLLEVPGYDPASGLIFIPSADFPPVPIRASADDARIAIGQLLEPLVDFPFVDGSDRAAAVATILTLVGRHAIDGCVPMISVRGPTVGTGKGLLADQLARIGTGRVAARTALPKDDTELRKLILVVGLEGVPVILLDNVNGSLGSQSLSAALTARTWRGRVLGVSASAEVPLDGVWLTTGNNTCFRADLGRRVIPIDMDPKLEHPEDRSDFAIPDLQEWTREQRPRLVVAALTILHAYTLEGRPPHGGPRKGSFEPWDDLVRGACIWAGLPDPCAGTQRIRRDADDDVATLRTALTVWRGAFGCESRTAAEAMRAADTSHGLRDALLAVTGREKLEASSLGYALRRVRGRIVGELRFDSNGTSPDGVTLWSVQETPR